MSNVVKESYYEFVKGYYARDALEELRQLIFTVWEELEEFISTHGRYCWLGSFGIVTVYPPLTAATITFVPTILTV